MSLSLLVLCLGISRGSGTDWSRFADRIWTPISPLQPTMSLQLNEFLKILPGWPLHSAKRISPSLWSHPWLCLHEKMSAFQVQQCLRLWWGIIKNMQLQKCNFSSWKVKIDESTLCWEQQPSSLKASTLEWSEWCTCDHTGITFRWVVCVWWHHFYMNIFLALYFQPC